MKKIILLISIMSYLNANAQDTITKGFMVKGDSLYFNSDSSKLVGCVSPRDTVALGPETLYVRNGKTIKIITFNPAVEVLIVKHFANSQMTLWANKKKDRLDDYVLYTIHLPLIQEGRLLTLFNK